jgi:hypothetical protein
LAKILGYPTASIFSSFKLDKLYKINFLENSIVPEIKDDSGLLQDLFEWFNFEWFNKEIEDRKVDLNQIKEFLLEVDIHKSGFLIFGHRTYAFKLKFKTPLKEEIKSHTVKGWL